MRPKRPSRSGFRPAARGAHPDISGDRLDPLRSRGRAGTANRVAAATMAAVSDLPIRSIGSSPLQTAPDRALAGTATSRAAARSVPPPRRPFVPRGLAWLRHSSRSCPGDCSEGEAEAQLHRWATRETSAAPSEWQERCDSLGRRLGLRSQVPLRESPRVHGPLIVGWFRPMLVLPLGMLQSLPGLQIEALLLHELAHVHGRDPLIHLLQHAVETLLFYHPGVWWVSEQIRREREHRCDDRVIEAQGEGHSLAEALVTLAERMPASEPLGLAATDGSVASRVRRLLQ
ncbi:MAG: M56 family metallopeptidase, partial [Verrucomicrobiota bacterium]